MHYNDLPEFTYSTKNNFKQRAIRYLGKDFEDQWTKNDFRRLEAKIKKMKKSSKKAIRQYCKQLVHQVNYGN